MQFPIIEFRENNLFVLDFFEGQVQEDIAIRPFNIPRNLTRYVVDSAGYVWKFSHIGHDNNGLNKVISIFKNVSKDTYSVEICDKKNGKWLKDLVSEYIDSSNPDVSDMARSICDDITSIEEDEALAVTMRKLSL